MKIAASILDCKDRINSVIELNRTNISYVHIDVMDGKFVPSVHFDNIGEIRGINLVSKYPMDVHLMMDNPIEYIKELGNMNIEFITIHLEIDKDKKEIFKSIKDLGYKVGLSIKPNTNVKDIEPYLDDIDMVLVMSVEPGLGGQSFIESTVDRIKELKELIGSRNILIEVDGGINSETITKLEDVDIAVVGSYIMKSDNYYRRVQELLETKIDDISNYSNENNKKEIKMSASYLFKETFFFCLYLFFVVLAFFKTEFFVFSLCINLILLLLGSGYILFNFINKQQDYIKRKKIYLRLLIIGVLPFISLIEFVLLYGFSYFILFFGIFFVLAANLISVSVDGIKEVEK